ncbi:MAG: hypothetical protein NC411_07695 [Bacteroides sp.]|nr:hypothetical protein [Bacteroides sp.]
MKRLLYLLFVLPLLGLISSCDDDKNLPDVNLSIDYEGATAEDGTLYVVQGDTLNITALRAIPAEGTKAATIGVAAYFWDGIPQGRTAISPFPISIYTADMEVGQHYLGVDATILQVDKEVGFAITSFPIVIVADDTQQPGDDQTGTITPETRISDKEN